MVNESQPLYTNNDLGVDQLASIEHETPPGASALVEA